MNTEIINKMIDKGLTVSTMESCTGGLMSSVITDVSGSSEIFPGGFVTYSNAAKIRQGVREDVIDRFGVYSGETAAEMAHVCQNSYGTLIGIGITGTLGRKDPHNKDSVPGQAFYCIMIGEDRYSYELQLDNNTADREKNKRLIVSDVLDKLSVLLESY